MEELICLGIESTAHTFGVGVMAGEKILADERAIYFPPKGKGIIPTEAALHHKKNKEKVIEAALQKAGLRLEDINILSYSAGPGLPPCLLVGAEAVFSLSKKHKKPVVPVNHMLAHVEIGKFETRAKDPVVVYLSGGNTMIIVFENGRYRVFGETEDIPLGNCLDVLAREMGLEMPGGPKLEELAAKGKNYEELPYVVKGMDVSFTGILTHATKLLRKGVAKEDLAYSLQETCFAMLTEVTERAMACSGKEEVLLVGGVAANRRLQEMMRVMCEERGAKFHVVSQAFSADNGVMIALVGILSFGTKQGIKNKINPNWRIDEVEVGWV